MSIEKEIKQTKDEIAQIETALERHTNALKRLEKYSKFWYYAALPFVIAFPILPSLWPASKSNLAKEKLSEDLIIARNKLRRLGKELDCSEDASYMDVYSKAAAEQQQQLSSLMTAMKASYPADEKIFQSLVSSEDSSGIFSAAEILRQRQLAEDEFDELHRKIIKINQDKVAQKTWKNLARFFSTVATIALLISIFVTPIPLVVAALCLVSAVFLSGFYHLSRKETADKLKAKTDLAKTTKNIVNLSEQLEQQQRYRQIDQLKQKILANQQQIRVLKTLKSGDGELQDIENAFEKIEILNLSINSLEAQNSQVLEQFQQSREALQKADASFRFRQKICSHAASIAYALAFAVVITGVVFPPFGLAVIAGIGVYAAAAAVCSGIAIALTAMSASYYSKKRDLIKNKLQSIDQQEDQELGALNKEKKEKKLEITGTIGSIINAQQKEIKQLQQQTQSEVSIAPQQGQVPSVAASGTKLSWMSAGTDRLLQDREKPDLP